MAKENISSQRRTKREKIFGKRKYSFCGGVGKGGNIFGELKYLASGGEEKRRRKSRTIGQKAVY